MDKLEIPYAINYRNIKYPRLEFKTGTLQLILPKNYEKQNELLEKHKTWINKKQQEIQNAIKKANIKQLNYTRTLPQLKNLVTQLILSFQRELNVEINKIYFRKMKTKWASRSKNNNLTLNTLLRYLPEDLIRYIIFHETLHTIERRHNQRFWNLVKKKFQDYEDKEKDLLAYWFLIQKL